ncbi:flagellin [Comamonas aquatica]|uniref:flagellin n=1 Tax=Comamonas aquatica TaxID=225991 RepID=UPI00244CAE27|nr:flagellin [Comamonas aquatica]MDH0901014.1 flagellin [Comamonas aquatica]
MAATINTNIASINAQRNLTLSGQSLNTTMQRLSSGLRVNSAKDDAAGLAIAERMNTQVKGMTVASRNANDGISLAQTTEGALGKIGDMLQRMRELAVQAGNATNSKSDRQALQLEVKQLSDEIDRVAKQTSFNGQKVLDGSFAGAVFQVGANSGDNITLGALVDTRSEKISNITYAQTDVSSVDTLDSTSNTTLADYGLEATGLGIQVTPPGQTVSLPDLPPASSRQERLGQVVEAINNKSADTGVTAFLVKREGTEEYDIEMRSGKLDGNGMPVTISMAGFSASATGIANQTIGGTTASSPGVVYQDKGIDSIDVSTQSGAWEGLKKIDSAIDQVNSARATLGAIQTRFETAVSNIDVQIENLAAARGRIIDADFAVETANLSRTQILQQAGTAMVAQANQIPQNVLQLLQG